VGGCGGAGWCVVGRMGRGGLVRAERAATWVEGGRGVAARTDCALCSCMGCAYGLRLVFVHGMRERW
jgi:hypothetical protein